MFPEQWIAGGGAEPKTPNTGAQSGNNFTGGYPNVSPKSFHPKLMHPNRFHPRRLTHDCTTKAIWLTLKFDPYVLVPNFKKSILSDIQEKF